VEVSLNSLTNQGFTVIRIFDGFAEKNAFGSNASLPVSDS